MYRKSNIYQVIFQGKTGDLGIRNSIYIDKKITRFFLFGSHSPDSPIQGVSSGTISELNGKGFAADSRFVYVETINDVFNKYALQQLTAAGADDYYILFGIAD